VGRARVARRGQPERVTIRRAGDGDLAIVRALWEEYAREIAAVRQTPWNWDWEDVEPRLGHAAVFLAEVGGAPAGFAIASRSRPDIGHVDDLFVRPAHRRRGVAAAILRELARAFRERGVEHVALDVDAGNETARTLYESFGFTRYADRFFAEVGALEDALARRVRS
jgi:ribosomal protein S18 acetylase RimI-like enzyme